MRILKVEIVHQEQQDSIYKEVGLGADIVEVLEDGYINLEDVSGAISNWMKLQIDVSISIVQVLRLPFR